MRKLGRPRPWILPRYRVPRYFRWALPRTALFQMSTTAYRVISSRHYRVPRYFKSALPHTAMRYFLIFPFKPFIRALRSTAVIWALRALPRTASFPLGATAYRADRSWALPRIPHLCSLALPRTASFCGSSTALPPACGSTTAGAFDGYPWVFQSRLWVDFLH